MIKSRWRWLQNVSANVFVEQHGLLYYHYLAWSWGVVKEVTWDYLALDIPLSWLWLPAPACANLFCDFSRSAWIHHVHICNFISCIVLTWQQHCSMSNLLFFFFNTPEATGLFMQVFFLCVQRGEERLNGSGPWTRGGGTLPEVSRLFWFYWYCLSLRQTSSCLVYLVKGLSQWQRASESQWYEIGKSVFW